MTSRKLHTRPDDLSVDPLGHVPTLERPAIVELDDVLAAALRVFGDVLGAADEDVRVLQLRQDERRAPPRVPAAR